MSSYAHKYRSVWENDSELKGWVAPDPSDNKRALCKLCRCSLSAHKKDLLLHSKSKKHAESVKKCNAVPSRKITKVGISTKRKIAELKTAAFIAEHCSTRTADHLSELINELDVNSEFLKSMKIHRTKCTALILNVIAPCLLKDLISDVGNEKYSLIIDESTAIDCTKMMCIMIKYFSKSRKEIKTDMYRLIEIEAGDAATLYSALRSQLIKDQLPLENLIGIGVDGANVMVGLHTSISSLLQNTINKDLVVIKCVCHSLHLAAEHSFRVLPKHLDFIIRETHNWFSCSSKRQIVYKKLYETMNEQNPKKIDKLSGTRWLARSNAVSKIIDQWDILKLHFQMAKESERCYVAQQLFDMLADKGNFLYMTFLKKILKEIETVNRAFQSEKTNPLKLLKSYLSILIPPMQFAKVLDKDLISFNFSDYVMGAEFLHFGYSFNKAAVGIDKKEVDNIRERCKSFLVELCQQMQNRLPNNIDILKKINFLTPENATAQIGRPDITPLAVHFKSICEDVDKTVSEWEALHRIEWKNTLNAEHFWIEVAENKNALKEPRFREISKLALSLLSLPFSNATVEKAFSLVNIIKDKLRNRLSIPSTEAILRVRFHLMKNGCVAFKPTEAMLNDFNQSMYHTSAENSSALDIFDVDQ